MCTTQVTKHKKVVKYINGLPYYIHVDVEFLNLTTLDQAYRHASKIEEKFRSKSMKMSANKSGPIFKTKLVGKM
jgi:hypothetical protein